MGERTVEELQLELDTLKKQNLEREVENEKVKLVQAEELKKKEADEKLRKQIESEVREKVITELSNKSNISSAKPETTGGNNFVEQFKTDYIAYANNDLDLQKKLNKANQSGLNVFKGRTYEDIVKDLKAGIKKRGA